MVVGQRQISLEGIDNGRAASCLERPVHCIYSCAPVPARSNDLSWAHLLSDAYLYDINSTPDLVRRSHARVLYFRNDKER